jgi:SAM-dependent methyltransferase
MNSTPETPPSERAETTPKIYELAAQNAGADDISRQMYVDFFSARDPEKVYLGLRALRARGPEGLAQIRIMSHGSDELSRLLKKIQDEMPSDDEIEKLLGISRFPTTLTNPAPDVKHYFETCRKYMPDSNFRGDAEDLYELYRDERKSMDGPGQPANVDGSIEDLTFNVNAVFGADEPTYLELLGPEEILRLREMQKPRLLLLGSLVVYSARDFAKFGKKLNPGAETVVLDIDPLMIQLMTQDDEASKNELLLGDARNIPMEEGSVDQVYTNNLFHYLHDKNNKQLSDLESIESLLKASARVLKPGGSMIIKEQPFSEFKKKNDYEIMVYKAKLLSKAAGFSDMIMRPKDLSYVFRQNNSSSKIDENGFPHYDKLMEEAKQWTINSRFVK